MLIKTKNRRIHFHETQPTRFIIEIERKKYYEVDTQSIAPRQQPVYPDKSDEKKQKQSGIEHERILPVINE